MVLKLCQWHFKTPSWCNSFLQIPKHLKDHRKWALSVPLLGLIKNTCCQKHFLRKMILDETDFFFLNHCLWILKSQVSNSKYTSVKVAPIKQPIRLTSLTERWGFQFSLTKEKRCEGLYTRTELIRDECDRLCSPVKWKPCVWKPSFFLLPVRLALPPYGFHGNTPTELFITLQISCSPAQWVVCMVHHHWKLIPLSGLCRFAKLPKWDNYTD